jgi:CheY-like chemotaxis protein
MTPTRSSRPTRPRIVVADDSGITRRLTVKLLESNGFAVTQAHDGQELLDLLLSQESGYFRLVVSDQIMPRMLGSEVLARAAGRAPFVIMTGTVTRELRAAATRYGVAALLTKPVELGELLEIIRAAITSAGQR